MTMFTPPEIRQIAPEIAPHFESCAEADITRRADYLAAIQAATPEVGRRGHRVLHGAMLADTEAEHIRALADLMDLPHGALVADLGCGIGEVARLMSADRPDLRWVQVNLSEAQIRQADGARVAADFHALPLADGSVDAVLFLFSLCHGDLGAALREAARVTRPGGPCFIFDLARLSGDNAASEAALFARFHAPETVVREAAAAGWRLVRGHSVDVRRNVLRELLADHYDTILSGCRPAIWQFTRCAHGG